MKKWFTFEDLINHLVNKLKFRGWVGGIESNFQNIVFNVLSELKEYNPCIEIIREFTSPLVDFARPDFFLIGTECKIAIETKIFHRDNFVSSAVSLLGQCLLYRDFSDIVIALVDVSKNFLNYGKNPKYRLKYIINKLENYDVVTIVIIENSRFCDDVFVSKNSRHFLLRKLFKITQEMNPNGCRF